MDRIRREIEFDKILDNFMQFIVNRNMSYYDSSDSYFSSKKPTLGRRIKFYLRFLILVIYTVKYGLLLLYPDKLQWTLLKDATIIFGEQADLVQAMMFSIGMLTLMSKLVFAYYESRKNLYLFNVYVDWKAGKPIYQISEKHMKKLTLKAFVIYYGFIRIAASYGFFFTILTTLWATIVTYLYLDYGNVIILCFWTIIVIMACNETIFTLAVSTYFFSIPITRLNYLFDELIDKLRVAIRWNNELRLHQILQSYDQLIDVIQQLSGPYNMSIGLVYCLVPYFISIIIELMRIKRNDLLFIWLRMAFLALFIATNITVFIINQISASITVRNKSIHKYLYPMFCNRRQRKLEIKLKFDSFIARLNTQFIGFYCFNLFEFTKMVYYQYVLSVSSCYFLILDIFKK